MALPGPDNMAGDGEPPLAAAGDAGWSLQDTMITIKRRATGTMVRSFSTVSSIQHKLLAFAPKEGVFDPVKTLPLPEEYVEFTLDRHRHTPDDAGNLAPGGSRATSAVHDNCQSSVCDLIA
jgi:hypothetical protein